MTERSWWRAVSIAPALLLFGLLTLLPLVLLLALGLHDIVWTSAGVSWSFVGLRHYLALASDGLLRASVWNTLVFALFAVGLQMAFGLTLALLVGGVTRGRTAYRMVFLLPILIPGIVIGAIWKLMFSYDFGIINLALGVVGLAPQDWLGERSLALGSIIFRLILAFKVFDEVYLLTGGGPGTATEVISLTIYRRFFTEDRAGYGAAMSVATFVLVAVLVAAAASAGRRTTR
jgi:multiple sugar transport system permease protein